MPKNCDRCHQKHATVILTEITVEGQPVEQYLCETCAAKQGVVAQAPPTDVVLKEFIKQSAGILSLQHQACPTCGMTIKEFHGSGLLGCSHDYAHLHKFLEQVVKKMQGGAAHHLGKCPRSMDDAYRRNTSLLRLQRELEEAVQREDYERAASLRDEIATVKAQSHD